MDELILPVTYNAEELEFPIKMYAYGYTFRVEVLMGETTTIFEPDEESSYRALISPEQLGNNRMLNIGLLQTIAEVLEKLR